MVGGKGSVGFRQLLEACRDSKFVALGLGVNVVDGFKLSPIGRMLRNNLRDEFRRGEAGTAVYEGSSGIPMRENLSFVKETFDPNSGPRSHALLSIPDQPVATLQIVLDAFESGGDASVRIHRKLAPFKCGIVCLSDNPALMPELRDLAKHLCNVLRKANLPVLDCSERNGDRSLFKQLHHLDSIAVPYCLLLRDQCLQNGLFQLPSAKRFTSRIYRNIY
ncbi:DNA polymerase subunit gamma-2, mitochondrial [Culex quinquefasciatus]|uniref:DNA polymerase subunit gamma-2, mitochondrial n=1 Tax=Culex quinquefasciatus TaxID=7176 RepID=UPI0018E38F46|nr:DNA polymerase subunit gamma-2, mitochondrial [Culex quinquefasciatus]